MSVSAPLRARDVSDALGQVVTRHQYVCRTRPFCETDVHMKLERKGFISWLPEVVFEGRTGRRREKRYTKLEPLLPGYLILTLDLEIDEWELITPASIDGVIGLLGGERPTRVATREVEDLRARFAAGEFARGTVQQKISAGDHVSFNFRGRECLGICNMSRNDRLKIFSDDVLGGKIDLPADIVTRRAG